MPDIVIQTAKTADRIDFISKLAKTEIANKIGLRVPALDDKDIKKLSELLEKNKKPVDFVISFDGEAFSYFTRVGSTKSPITSIVIANDPSIPDKEKVLSNLVIYGAATKVQVEAFRKAHPDKQALEKLKKEMDDLKRRIEEDQKKLADLTKRYREMGGK